MKKYRNILTLIAAISSVLFFSCSNLQQDEKDTDAKAHIYLKLDNSARSVNPEKISLEAFDKFTLKGKLSSSEEEKKETLAAWESDSEETENAKSAYEKMTSDKSLLCDAGEWTFTLTAYRNAAEVYSSEITKTVSVGQNELSFSLSALKTGTGSVQIKLSFAKDEQIKAVKAGLYSYSGNAETAAEGFALEKLEIQDDSASEKSFVLYGKPAVPSGNYIAKFYFYRDESCTEQIQSPYTTLVKVRGGRKSAAEVETEIDTKNNRYWITYNLDGGTNSNENPAFYLSDSETITLAEPTKENCKFLGWYTSSNFGERKVDIKKGSNGNITLYAKWAISVAEAIEKVKLLVDNENLYLTIIGNVNNSDIYVLSNAIKESKGKIYLDLQSLTGATNLSFENCSKLASITLPNTIKRINDSAFSGCSGLTSIAIPASVTSIGNQVFDGCISLSDLRFEDSTEAITLGYKTYEPNGYNGNGNGRGLFYDCPINTLYIGRNINYTYGNIDSDHYSHYGYSAFANNHTKGFSVTVASGVTSVNECEFYFCTGLTSIILPNTITSIGNDAFYYCRSLVSITLLDGVTSIGSGAFDECIRLTDITLPDTITIIANYAFHCCESLTSISIPEALTSIGPTAFLGCDGLTSVEFKSALGWSCWKWDGGSRVEDSLSELSLIDKSTAATYLKSTYCDWNWVKK